MIVFPPPLILPPTVWLKPSISSTNQLSTTEEKGIAGLLAFSCLFLIGELCFLGYLVFMRP